MKVILDPGAQRWLWLLALPVFGFGLAAFGAAWVAPLVGGFAVLLALVASAVPGLRTGLATTAFLLLAPVMVRSSLPGGPGLKDPIVWGPLAAMGLGAAGFAWKRAGGSLWLAYALVLLVLYFSGSAGGPDPMRAWLASFLGPDQIEGALILIRKTIHFGFYATLGGLAWLHFREASSSALLALGFALSTAVFDEARQAGLASRSGQPQDVLLDLSGAACAVWVVSRVVAARTRQAQ